MKEAGEKKNELCPPRGRCVIGGNFLPFYLHLSMVRSSRSENEPTIL